jgi:aminoacrylate hydrolase
MLSRIAAICRFDRKAELGRIRHKTLVFVARDDIVTPAYFSGELARLIPDARLVMLPDGGHLFPNVHGETFRRTLTDFLAAKD